MEEGDRVDGCERVSHPEARVEREWLECACDRSLLHPRGVAVAYEVDATDLAKTLPPVHPPFDRIIWNFPCVPVQENGGGRDGDGGVVVGGVVVGGVVVVAWWRGGR